VCIWAAGRRFQLGHYVTSDERLTGKGRIGKDLRRAGSAINEVISNNLPGRTVGTSLETSLIFFFFFLVFLGGVRLSEST
jgi:hypothetical protein